MRASGQGEPPVHGRLDVARLSSTTPSLAPSPLQLHSFHTHPPPSARTPCAADMPAAASVPYCPPVRSRPTGSSASCASRPLSPPAAHGVLAKAGASIERQAAAGRQPASCRCHPCEPSPAPAAGPPTLCRLLAQALRLLNLLGRRLARARARPLRLWSGGA